SSSASEAVSRTASRTGCWRCCATNSADTRCRWRRQRAPRADLARAPWPGPCRVGRMVFAPTHDIAAESHEPAAMPRRRDHVTPPTTSGDAQRLAWRAVVHASHRDSVHTTWHLTSCGAPLDAAAHCPEGQELIERVGDPDGHCLDDGTCARC